MCLSIEHARLTDLKAALPEETEIIVYKCFYVKPVYKNFATCQRYKGAVLCGRHQSHYQYGVGVHSAKPRVSYNANVHEGIHVCTTRAEAEKIRGTMYNPANFPILEFRVKVKDVLFIGNQGNRFGHQAIVPSITITQEHLDKINQDHLALFKKDKPQYFPKPR